MKILIIPDVHGRTFWKPATKLVDEYDRIIFLGDYLDAYDYKAKRVEEDNFKEILEFANKNKEKVVLLLGNHDCVYLLDLLTCSRYNWQKAADYKKLFVDNKDLFKLYYIIDNYLFSHAGVYTYWMKKCNLKLNDLQDFNDPKVIKALQIVDEYRGGSDEVGSCIWADVRCSENHTFYEGYFNIFGHTQLNYHIKTKEFACLDCRQIFELDTITNKITVLFKEEGFLR